MEGLPTYRARRSMNFQIRSASQLSPPPNFLFPSSPASPLDRTDTVNVAFEPEPILLRKSPFLERSTRIRSRPTGKAPPYSPSDSASYSALRPSRNDRNQFKLHYFNPKSHSARYSSLPSPRQRQRVASLGYERPSQPPGLQLQRRAINFTSIDRKLRFLHSHFFYPRQSCREFEQSQLEEEPQFTR